MKKRYLALAALAAIGVAGFAVHNHVERRVVALMEYEAPETTAFKKTLETLPIPGGNSDFLNLEEPRQQDLIKAAKRAQKTSSGLIPTIFLMAWARELSDQELFSSALTEGLKEVKGNDLDLFFTIALRHPPQDDKELLTAEAVSKLASCHEARLRSIYPVSPSIAYWIDAYRLAFGLERFSCA